MEFESAQQMAERLGVTVRAVQKWAAAGKIPGAKKIGRSWFIPEGITGISEQVEADLQEKTEEQQERLLRVPMPLMNSAFPIGKCREYIETIPDEDIRKVALGEYYYFSGQAELAAQIMEPYLDSTDTSLRYSAYLIYSYANLSRGYIHLARFSLGLLKEELYKSLKSESTPQLHAIGIFTVTAASVLLHLPVSETPPLENYIRYLPNGLRLFACYVLAHKAYLEKDYSRSLGIADTALSMCMETYPIAEIYMHLIATMNLMSLMCVDEAKERFITAWKLAQPDGLIESFGEHHGLLQGMIEVFFKKNYPSDYERIIAITYSFSAGWRKIHNPDAQRDVADNLTTTEFTVAMLYNRGWKVKEIAAHMDVSSRTVSNYIQIIYSKLNINDKRALEQFMLR